MKILNANKKNLSQTTSQVPDVSGAIQRNLQPLTFVRMQKRIIDGFVKSIPVTEKYLASIQPLKPKDLVIKPQGERAWSWYMIHSLVNLELKLGDQFESGGAKYKIMGRSNYSQFGYFYQECIEDLR